jgi:hypothetical protein
MSLIKVIFVYKNFAHEEGDDRFLRKFGNIARYYMVRVPGKRSKV